MKIFFDTEFYEDGKTIDLMSIGMVREDGKELYLVNDECDWNKPIQDEWHQLNTIPFVFKKDTDDSFIGPKDVIKNKIQKFVGINPEFWAYYADYDWVVLCQLFGRMIDLPSSWPMYCRDLKQELDIHFYKPNPQSTQEHYALSDALWVKQTYEDLQRHIKNLNDTITNNESFKSNEI